MFGTYLVRPYLSVVVVTRNDNYGGGLLERLQTFQRAIVERCTEARLPVEIVVVDWNPPPENSFDGRDRGVAGKRQRHGPAAP